MKNIFEAMAVACAMLAAVLTATPAYAQEAGESQQAVECQSGSLCGIPLATVIVAIDLGGATAGEGLVYAFADGPAAQTEAWVEKTSDLDLSVEIAGGACQSICGSGKYDALANETILTYGFAKSTGTNEAFAGVANASQGAVSLMGIARTGAAPAASTPPAHPAD
jgi:hypothetical protein